MRHGSDEPEVSGIALGAVAIEERTQSLMLIDPGFLALGFGNAFASLAFLGRTNLGFVCRIKNGGAILSFISVRLGLR